ncbi:MAG: TetR/AcrR family transcriptional regulator [[Clostridium] fimetarium]|nr:TetR/AcrR family transcriptional regulator [Alistipes timonensis]MCM1405499.1 TetR/AcrR family transcriptional regulator [[Clostridium] fimetarium]
MGSKTRDKLIEVARQLFARKGVENTTMLDIANASDKGRRTIYTYFKNKKEIHQAVIERESEQLVSRERSIISNDTPAAERISELLHARADIVAGQATGWQMPDSIPDLLKLDFRRSGRTKRLAALKEMQIVREILAEGVRSGEFDREQAKRAESLVVVLLLGIENPLHRQALENLGLDRQRVQDQTIEFVVEALRRPSEK